MISVAQIKKRSKFGLTWASSLSVRAVKSLELMAMTWPARAVSMTICTHYRILMVKLYAVLATKISEKIRPKLQHFKTENELLNNT